MKRLYMAWVWVLFPNVRSLFLLMRNFYFGPADSLELTMEKCGNMRMLRMNITVW